MLFLYKNLQDERKSHLNYESKRGKTEMGKSIRE